MEDPRDESTGSFPNKYELAIIAAREARRMNDMLGHSSEEGGKKVTLTSLNKVLKRKVKYTYEDEERRGQ